MFSSVGSMPLPRSRSRTMDRSVRPLSDNFSMTEETPNSSAKPASSAALPAPPLAISVPSMSNRQTNMQEVPSFGARSASKGKPRPCLRFVLRCPFGSHRQHHLADQRAAAVQRVRFEQPLGRGGLAQRQRRADRQAQFTVRQPPADLVA